MSPLIRIINLFPLGGHASDTKRATNLKSFVRKDQGKAIIEAQLYLIALIFLRSKHFYV